MADLEYLRLSFQNRADLANVYGMFRAMAELGAPLRKVDIRSPYAFDVEMLEDILPETDVCVRTCVVKDEDVRTCILRLRCRCIRV